MNFDELAQLKERLHLKQICQRAHLFALAYRDIQDSLKSTNFKRYGICKDYAWPSHWQGISALGSETLTFCEENGRMVVEINAKNNPVIL